MTTDNRPMTIDEAARLFTDRLKYRIDHPATKEELKLWKESERAIRTARAKDEAEERIANLKFYMTDSEVRAFLLNIISDADLKE